MSILSGVSDFFGLDIGTTAIRVVQLSGGGPARSLVKYGFAPVDVKISQSDAVGDRVKLGQAVVELLNQTRITSRNVVAGIPSQKVFTTIIDIDRLTPDEMAKSIQYQADSIIPTPTQDSTIDWAQLGDSPTDKNKVEVLITSVPNNFVETRLDMLEDIGLNVLAFEQDSMALSRAVLPHDSASPQIIIGIGNLYTDLIIVSNGSVRLTRTIPTGTDAIIKAAMQNLNIDAKQAEQFVFKFGLAKDKLEGQVYQGLIGMVDILVSEIDKSIKFFQKRYGEATKIERVIVTGGASALPEFPLYIANKFGINVEIGNAWRNVSFSSDRQNELLAVSNHFGVAAGLAEREQ